MIGFKLFLGSLALSVCVAVSEAQEVAAPAPQISAPVPQTGSVSGTVTDTDGAAIPGATIVMEGATQDDRRTVKSDDQGFFQVLRLKPLVSYQLRVSASGFGEVTQTQVVQPGQAVDLSNVQLKVSVDTTVTAESPEQVALEQVKAEEKQRVFGVVPNFFVVYDANPQPLSTKLKYQLAFRAGTDVVTLVASAFTAGLYQAADTPSYVEGAKGYGQRFGAVYASAFTDVMIGGAVLPSLLHQDPRYFYQGTGTKKSRAKHALLSPFLCRGDNGKVEFNYSSIGGDLASGALSNIYYRPEDRGVGLVFSGAAITTAGRMLNALAQEFLLKKLTSGAPKTTRESETKVPGPFLRG